MGSLRIIKQQLAKDGTIKILYENLHKERFESVIIPNHNKKLINLCLSTQAGCIIGCKFCCTPNSKFKKLNLSYRNILNQYNIGKDISMKNYPGYKFSDVLFFGMGEPLLNSDNLFSVLRYFDKYGISSAISTIGVSNGVKEILKLKIKNLPRLQISLHKLNHREALIPYENKDPIKNTLNLCKEYYLKSKKYITINYLLLKGINDSYDDLMELAKFNPDLYELKISYYNGDRFNSPSNQEVGQIIKQIRDLSASYFGRSINVMEFKSTGADIMAACGELRGSE